MEELKKFTIEEWNKIPGELPQKLVKNYLKRVKKVIEIKGNRLEPFHLNEIRKEEEKENEEEKKDKELINKKRTLKMKKIYNDKNLNKIRNKEIRELNREKKGIPKKYKKSKIKNVRDVKREEREEIDAKIKELKEMTLIEYLQHINEEKKTKFEWNQRYHVKNEIELEEDEETVASIEETINKILKLSQFIDKNNVKYKLAFKKIDYSWDELIKEKK